MSFCGKMSQMMNEALAAAFRAGMLTVVAAGNEGNDASKFSPSSASSALVVGALNNKDERPEWSNYGENVSTFAPGDHILSAWTGNLGQQPGYRIMSGTSMATPHVSGMILYLMSLTGVRGPQNLKDLVGLLSLRGALKNYFYNGVVKNSMSSKAMIAYNGAYGL